MTDINSKSPQFESLKHLFAFVFVACCASQSVCTPNEMAEDVKLSKILEILVKLRFNPN